MGKSYEKGGKGMKGKVLTAALALALALSACGGDGELLLGNDKAQADLSRLAETGTLSVRYLGDSPGPVKVRLIKEETYTNDLDPAGSAVLLPLTQGEGTYTLKVYENLRDDRYKVVFEGTVELTLDDPNAPFLHPNLRVDYGEESAAAALAGELTQGLEGEGERIAAILDYVTGHISYDWERMETVEPGYLPDLDQVLEAGKGICYDYAALTAAMLRSQGVPCKLDVGWLGEESVSHAWVEVFCAGACQASGLELSPGWNRLDPTYLASDPIPWDVIEDEESYHVRYVY